VRCLLRARQDDVKIDNDGKGNEPSIKFYEGIGATNMGKEWQQMRVDGDSLESLARRGAPGDGK